MYAAAKQLTAKQLTAFILPAEKQQLRKTLAQAHLKLIMKQLGHGIASRQLTISCRQRIVQRPSFNQTSITTETWLNPDS